MSTPSTRKWMRIPGRLKEILRPFKWVLTNGPAVRRKNGRSLAKQLQDVLHLRDALNFDPWHYYLWHLYRPERMARASDWVTQRRSHALTSAAARMTDPGQLATLDDKLLFHRHCEQHGLPSIPILATIGDGQLNDLAGSIPEILDGVSLFAKPTTGFQGRGARRWDWNGEAHLGETGVIRTPEEILTEIKSLSESTPYILQPFIRNHDVIEPISGGVLCSIRAITVNVSGDIRLALAKFQSSGGNTVSTHGGIETQVDASSGILGKTIDRADLFTPARRFRHPQTNTVIAGLQLPCWQETVDIALRGHRSFPDVLMIGWDIALTPDGPVLIEGNDDPGIEAAEVLYDQPITDFIDYERLEKIVTGVL